jgi:hypothetical protein
MKRTFRVITVLSIAALIPTAAKAQAITGSIQATADIATVFAFGTPVPLNFGSIVPGTGATASGNIPLSRNVGVIFTLPDAANTGRLTLGAVNLQPTYTCGVGTTAAAITTPFSSCIVATSVLTQLPPVGTNTEFVIFNGTLAAGQTNIAPGTYTGTIRITATPN